MISKGLNLMQQGDPFKRCISEHSHCLRLAHEYAEIGNKWASEFWRERAESYLKEALRIQSHTQAKDDAE